MKVLVDRTDVDDIRDFKVYRILKESAVAPCPRSSRTAALPQLVPIALPEKFPNVASQDLTPRQC